MDFRIIKHNENETVIQWYPNLIDKVLFGRRNHVAWYVPNNGGYQLWTTNKPVRNVIVPDADFFERIKNTTI